MAFETLASNPADGAFNIRSHPLPYLLERAITLLKRAKTKTVRSYLLRQQAAVAAGLNAATLADIGLSYDYIRDELQDLADTYPHVVAKSNVSFRAAGRRR